MTKGFFKRLTSRHDEPQAIEEAGKYLDLGEKRVDDDALIEKSEGQMTIRVGEMNKYEDLKNFTSLLYDGDILFLDISGIVEDDLLIQRVSNELKTVVNDINGDVTAISDTMIIVTPKGVKVDRRLLKFS